MLAALALLAIAASSACGPRASGTRRTPAPPGSPPPRGSYTALVGSSGAKEVGQTTACGDLLEPARSAGIESPVLPCGVRLYLTFRGEACARRR